MNQRIYFILMRDSSEEPCVPLTKTNKLREQGGALDPVEGPLGGSGVWPRRTPHWANTSSPEATERTVTHDVMAEVKARSYCWQKKSEVSETEVCVGRKIFPVISEWTLSAVGDSCIRVIQWIRRADPSPVRPRPSTHSWVLFKPNMSAHLSS